MGWGKVSNRLAAIRRQRFRACPDVTTFVDFLENDPIIKATFGTFRNEEFYQGTIQIANDYSSIFILKQLTDQMQPGANIYFDGTFKVLPLDFKQLFIVLALIDGMFYS